MSDRHTSDLQNQEILEIIFFRRSNPKITLLSQMNKKRLQAFVHLFVKIAFIC